MTPCRPAVTPRTGLTALIIALLCLGLLGCQTTTKVYRSVTKSVTGLWQGRDTDLGKRVAVASLTSQVKGMEPKAQAMRDEITKRLAGGGGIVLVDYARVKETTEQLAAKPEAQSLDPRFLTIQAARIEGINAVLAGGINDLSVERRRTGIYGFRDYEPFLILETTLTLIDASNGTSLAQTSIRREDKISDMQATAIQEGKPAPSAMVDAMVRETIDEAVDWVREEVSNMAWTGFVLQIEADKLRISAGRDTGLPSGTTLVVYQLGRKIVTGSGQTLHLPGPMVGRVRITDLEARTAWAVPVADDEGKTPAMDAFQQGQPVKVR